MVLPELNDFFLARSQANDSVARRPSTRPIVLYFYATDAIQKTIIDFKKDCQEQREWLIAEKALLDAIQLRFDTEPFVYTTFEQSETVFARWAIEAVREVIRNWGRPPAFLTGKRLLPSALEEFFRHREAYGQGSGVLKQPDQAASYHPRCLDVARFHLLPHMLRHHPVVSQYRLQLHNDSAREELTSELIHLIVTELYRLLKVTGEPLAPFTFSSVGSGVGFFAGINGRCCHAVEQRLHSFYHDPTKDLLSGMPPAPAYSREQQATLERFPHATVPQIPSAYALTILQFCQADYEDWKWKRGQYTRQPDAPPRECRGLVIDCLRARRQGYEYTEIARAFRDSYAVMRREQPIPPDLIDAEYGKRLCQHLGTGWFDWTPEQHPAFIWSTLRGIYTFLPEWFPVSQEGYRIKSAISLWFHEQELPDSLRVEHASWLRRMRQFMEL